MWISSSCWPRSHARALGEAQALGSRARSHVADAEASSSCRMARKSPAFFSRSRRGGQKAPDAEVFAAALGHCSLLSLNHTNAVRVLAEPGRQTRRRFSLFSCEEAEKLTIGSGGFISEPAPGEWRSLQWVLPWARTRVSWRPAQHSHDRKPAPQRTLAAISAAGAAL